MNKHSTYNWLNKVITSCNTLSQLYNTKNLITQFNKLFKDEELLHNLCKAKKNQRLILTKQ